MLLTATAFAATYAGPEGDDFVTFEYDEASFEITLDDHTDDEDLVILTVANPDWGESYIRIHEAELEDGESFPTLDSFADMEAQLGFEAQQGEWNGFADVIMYAIDDGDTFEQTFIIPLYDDDDHEVEDILTIVVSVSNLESEEADTGRSDAISAVLDTLQVLDD